MRVINAQSILVGVDIYINHRIDTPINSSYDFCVFSTHVIVMQQL